MPTKGDMYFQPKRAINKTDTVEKITETNLL
jgi:hypothetical protein